MNQDKIKTKTGAETIFLLGLILIY